LSLLTRQPNQFNYPVELIYPLPVHKLFGLLSFGTFDHWMLLN